MIDPALIERISALVGGNASSFERARGGYSPAARFTFRANRRSYFAKVGTTAAMSRELRREIAAYDRIDGDFMPRRIASEGHDSAPILILEDLSAWHWPPPWRDGQIEAVLRQIAKIHETAADLPTHEERHGKDTFDWPTVAADRETFLGLGLVSEGWLDKALPDLLEAESRCATEGRALTHWDIRSDNLCIRGQAVKLIDWNNACLGNSKLDLGLWLPSLVCEGGPAPETLIGHEPEIAARVAGFFAARAGLPEIENAPRVREVQKRQLEPALSWAIRALDLPPPD